MKTSPDGSIAYTYLGQKLTQAIDSTTTPSETHSFTWDDAFRVATNTEATRGVLSYTYTAADAVLTSAVTGGATTTYAYYPDGSLNTIQWSPVSG